jgi:hypothetical protein
MGSATWPQEGARMRPLRIQVAIGTGHEQRCQHTEAPEGKMCVGCVRVIIDQLLGIVQAAHTSDDEPLALGLVEQGLIRLDTQLAGISAIVRGQHAERQHLGGWTQQELDRVRVLGYSLPELAKAVRVVQELGLEDRIRPGDDDAGSTSSTTTYRRPWR